MFATIHKNIPVFGTKRIIQYKFNDHVVIMKS